MILKSFMNFAAALLIWFLLFLVLLWTTTRYGMGIFSGLTLTALISTIVLVGIIPPAELDHHYTLYLDDKPHRHVDTWVLVIYSLIIVLTIILVSAYVIFKAFEDRARRMKIFGDDYYCDHHLLSIFNRK